MEWTFNNDLILSIPTHTGMTVMGWCNTINKSTSWWYRNTINGKIYLTELLRICEAANVNPQAMFLCDGKMVVPLHSDGKYVFGWELSEFCILPTGKAVKWLKLMPTDVAFLTRQRYIRKERPSITTQVLLKVLNDNPDLSIADIFVKSP